MTRRALPTRLTTRLVSSWELGANSGGPASLQRFRPDKPTSQGGSQENGVRLRCFRKCTIFGQLVVARVFSLATALQGSWRNSSRARCACNETFDLAYLTEERSAPWQHQAGVFLDCSKCYEWVSLGMLEQFAIESGYPLT
eukprot:6482035-Amphidinium_carterae.1